MELLSYSPMDYYSLIVESIFTGFPIFLLLKIVSSKIKSDKTIFQKYEEPAFIVIRFAGLLLFIHWIVATIIDLRDPEGYVSLMNRMFGPYGVYYWIVVWGPILLSQIYWSEWIKKNNWINLTSALMLLFIFSAGKLIILITSLHRDYVPASWKIEEDPFGLASLNLLFNYGVTWCAHLMIFTVILAIVTTLQKVTRPNK